MTKSVWGKGDRETLELLKKQDLKGNWLNLAAGDGRYNSSLLEKVNTLTATDKDANELKKLFDSTPKKNKHKLETKQLDLTEPLPFNKHYFDGVFCTGTLHLFQPEILQKIAAEINRVLKPGGSLIIDFATDVKRVLPDGKLHFYENEPQYDLQTAKKLLSQLFKDYNLKIISSQVPKEKINKGNVKYGFTCNFLLASGKKKD
ncbi:MAG: class I SAM-dependent methyltransferase [Candidatus Micrarchaeota archaeon]